MTPGLAAREPTTKHQQRPPREANSPCANPPRSRPDPAQTRPADTNHSPHHQHDRRHTERPTQT
jgi:hypothetical protein